MLVVLAIFLVVWLMRRAGNFRSSIGGSLKILGGISLGTKERLLVVQVGDEQLLIGVAPGSISKLHVLEKPLEEIEQTTLAEHPFASRLKQAIKKSDVDTQSEATKKEQE